MVLIKTWLTRCRGSTGKQLSRDHSSESNKTESALLTNGVKCNNDMNDAHLLHMLNKT